MQNLLLFVRRYLQCLLGSIYFFLGGVLRKRHRPLLYYLSLHFGFEKDTIDPNAKPAPTVPQVDATTLFNDSTQVQISRVASANGNISPAELLFIAAFVNQQQPLACFEIGTFDGRTTQNIAANQPANGICYTLDLPPTDLSSTALPLAGGDSTYVDKPTSGARIAEQLHESGRIVQLYGDSGTFDFTPYHDKIDLMFVDGSHSYEYVLSDTEHAWKMVKSGGIILWHDYDSKWWPGVTRALNELQRNSRFTTMRHISGTALCYIKKP